MKIDFFERKVKKTQERFNQVFGTQTVCNIEERQTVIMAICWLSVLNKRIKGNAENAELVREFMECRNKLNKHFNQKERRKTYVELTYTGEIGPDTKAIRNRACQSQG